MRLPWIYTITAKTGLRFGGVCVHGHTLLMLCKGLCAFSDEK